MKQTFVKKAKYVFNTFFNTLGIEPNNLISYGERGIMTIEEGDTEYFDKLSPYEINKVRYFIWKGKRLPILFYAPFKEEIDLFDEVNKTKILPIDIIAFSFFFLSCWQEITLPSKRDKFGRFPHKDSIYYKLEITTLPIVNEYMNIFLDLLRIANPNLSYTPFWPDGKKFAVCLTHDIEDIRRWNKRNYREELKTIIRTKSLNLTLDYWIFPKVCAIENERGVSSTFYFLPHRYDIKALHFSRLFNRLKNCCEVGLHVEGTHIEMGKQVLEKTCKTDVLGVRHHFLQLNNPKDFTLHEKIGIKYDSSLGFAEHPGYRSGFAFPYYPYNPVKDMQFNVLELPLNIMDTSLIYYQQLSPRAMWRMIEQLLITTLNYASCLVVLWHESSFVNPVYIKIYAKILDWIRNNEGIGLSGKQLFNWWTKERLQLQKMSQN